MSIWMIAAMIVGGLLVLALLLFAAGFCYLMAWELIDWWRLNKPRWDEEDRRWKATHARI